MEKIVVGVDGSELARRGLRWAVEHADDDDVIVVVHAWSIPSAAGFEMPVDSIAEWELAAHRLVRELVADLAGGTDGPGAGPTIETRVVAGPAGATLCEEAADADHIVVGSRGHGGLKSLLLGSVSNYVAHHARCPVTIVSDSDRPG